MAKFTVMKKMVPTHYFNTLFCNFLLNFFGKNEIIKKQETKPQKIFTHFLTPRKIIKYAFKGTRIHSLIQSSLRWRNIFPWNSFTKLIRIIKLSEVQRDLRAHPTVVTIVIRSGSDDKILINFILNVERHQKVIWALKSTLHIPT